MAEIYIGGELVPKTMAKKVAKAEYVYDPNQDGKRQSEINAELYQSKDVLPFDSVVPSEIPAIAPITQNEPDEIIYSSFNKRFVAVVGSGGLQIHYYAWPGYEKYTDTTNDNKPYDNKVYLCSGKTYVWNGTDLVVGGGGEQVQSDWNQTNSKAKDFIKNKPTIPDTSNLANKQELSSGLSGKVDKVNGKGLSTNDYTNEDKNKLANLDSALASKANARNVYSKSETYNRTEIGDLFDAQERINITATDQTTDVNTLIAAEVPAEKQEQDNIIYCIGCWDGSQYDDSVYSEYAWNGSVYLLLSVKNGSQPIQNVPNNWSPRYNTDLSFVDRNGYSIVDFINGHICTKNFNSADSPKVTNPSKGALDFAITDNNENAIVIFENGHIRTKNFNSANFISSDYFWNLFNRYKGKKISILGDSISTWGDTDSRNQLGTYCYSYYPTETCRYSKNGNVTINGVTYQSIEMDVKDTWWMRLINNLGAVLGCNESYRGTLVTGSGSTTFNNQTRINHLGSNGKPNVILVYGGTNDAGNSVTLGTFNGGVYSDYDTPAKIAALDVSTFANAYKAMLIRLMYTYPNAEIVCILPTFTTSYYTISALDSYVEVIKEACDFFGIKWIDVRVSGISIFNKGNYLVDGIHPNTQGMQLLSNKIYKQLIFM